MKIILIYSGIFICVSVYSISLSYILTNAYIKKKYSNKITGNNIVYNNHIQKIIYLKSKKNIDIYKNSSNTYQIKFNNFTSKNIDILEFDMSNNNNYMMSNPNPSELGKFFYYNFIKKKNIKLTPGGIFGFHDTGICKIIKESINLNNLIFSGASAGSWNALFMVFKHKNIDKIIKIIFEINFDKISSIYKLQLELKNKILENFNSEDFDLDKLFISVCVLDNFNFKHHIYTEFTSLENALDCCIASSNIPFLTGKLILKFDNKICFDGGFLSNPYLYFGNNVLTINNSMWGKKRFITSIFSGINKTKLLYNDGLSDTIDNISSINIIFKN